MPQYTAEGWTGRKERRKKCFEASPMLSIMLDILLMIVVTTPETVFQKFTMWQALFTYLPTYPSIISLSSLSLSTHLFHPSTEAGTQIISLYREK